MASKLVQAFKQKDIRNKILFTLFIVLLYRLGCSLPVPGVPFHDIADQISQVGGGALAMLDLFSGGALGQMSFFALGILPYITASIILQLMGLVIPSVARWRRDGAEGRKHIVKWTRILTIGLGLLNAIGYDLMFQAQYGVVYPGQVPSLLSNIIVIFTLVVGVIVIMYMCEIIKQRTGFNGTSIIILVNICASVPAAFVQSVQTSGDGFGGLMLTIAAVIFLIIVLPVVVEVERAQRRVPVKSSKGGADSKYARSKETNYIPIPVDSAGLYGLIFASSMSMLPVYAAAWFTDVQWLQQVSAAMTSGWINWIITFILVVFFCFFMAGVNFNTEDIADNLKKQGSYIPGVRPGNATAEYLSYILNHITLFGAVFIGILAVSSSVLMYFSGNPLLQAFGGTSLLICISGSIQISSSIEQQVRTSDPEAVLRRLGR